MRSNAIVIARDTATVGIGAGQMSRVDAVPPRARARRARRSPAPCSPPTRSSRSPTASEAALDAGVRVIIQPGGVERDDEVIAAADDGGHPMVFTGRRHFLH